jgi:AraC-like DNA-binding protein
MSKITHIKRGFFFMLFAILLFPDNNLLAEGVKESTPIVQNDKESPNVLVFKKAVDKVKFNEEHLKLYKEQAIKAAENNNIEHASIYAEYYMKYSSEVGFIDSGLFSRFKETKEFAALYKKYSVNFTWLSFFYLFSSIIGFFIFCLLLFKKQNDKIATILISTFVLINSLFIFHIFLHSTNLKFRAPHTLYMSAISIYLYGPLIYFYFKRVALNYKFKKWDLLHLLPTVLIIIVFIPVFLMTGQEKINILLGVGVLDAQPYKILTVSTKMVSLLIYGILILRLLLKSKERIQLFTPALQRWMINLVFFVEVYVVAYFVYGILIMNVEPNFGFLFNLQVSIIASMVLYIGYTSYLRPNMFARDPLVKLIREKGKYTKSSLTPSYSEELKEKLIYLLETEKIYKKNNINLDFLSQRLDTTRHNASQVINENFNVSFFELINTYRIEEALEILKNDTEKKMNIIEVAYEVGFNNKVSFNKSFKKHLSQTPSQYIGSLNLK